MAAAAEASAREAGETRVLSTTPVSSCFEQLRHSSAVFDLDEESQAIRAEAMGMPNQMPTRGRKKKVKYSMTYYTIIQYCIT